MNKKLTIAALSLISLCSITAVTVSTVAWFYSGTKISFGNDPGNVDVSGGSAAAYYESGDGSYEDPYVISHRIHLYNLAWLQYIGYYNAWNTFHKDEAEIEIVQKYFVVKNDIDMDGLVIPPIGTEKYPFLGNFDGRGYTISNFTVSNDNPASDNSDFGVAHPIQFYGGTRPNVVGFFGVIGKLPNQSLTYDSSFVSVRNITLDDFTVSGKTESLLIGLAAGYVDGHLSDVKVGTSSVEVNGCKPITSITSNLSDYSLVGYAASTSSVSDFTKTISEKVHKQASAGMDGGFGNSVKFQNYNDWFYDLHETKGYDDLGSKNCDTGYMVDMSLSSTYSERYNKKEGTNFTLEMNAVRFGNPDAEIAFTRTANAYCWQFELFRNESGTGYTGSYFETQYSDAEFGTRNNSVVTAASGWQNENSYRYIDITFETPLARFNNATNARLIRTTTSATNTLYYVCNRNSTTYNIKNAYYSGGGFNLTNPVVFRLNTDCYLPLSFGTTGNTNYSSVVSTNTGYIIGRSLSANKYGNTSVKFGSYAKAQYLENALSNGAISSVQSYDFSTSTWKAITETTSNGDVTKGMLGNNELQRYADARNIVGTSISGGQTIHGLHFDNNASGNGDIDSSKTVTKQMITNWSNGAKNIKYPTGAINFYLQESGYISFFAGTYTTETTAPQNFFSLWDVDRTDATNFTLKEIKKIYKTSAWTEDNPAYVYEYSGDANKPAAAVGDPVFDVSILWTNKSAGDHRIYYFEIPVNAGHFAMGAVTSTNATNASTVQGAYMMYLDIGSHGRSTGNNVMDAFYTETTSSSDVYPSGVDFNITSLSVVGGNTGSLAIQYNAGTVTGSVEFAVAAKVAIDATIANCNINYKKNNTVLDVSDSTQTIGDITGIISGGGKRTLQATIVTSTSVTWQIEYQEKLDGSGGSYTKIIEGNLDRTDQGSSIVPAIFTSNMAEIKSAIMAVQLDYRGNDFSITNATYAGTTISLTIPTDELGSTVVTATFGTNYSSLNINGSPYSPPQP